jgi:hypothetical protein
VTLTYTVEPSDGNSYFEVDQNTGYFKVTDRKGLLSSSALRYKIKLFVKDSNVETPSNKTYIVYLDTNSTNNSSLEKI